MFSFENLTSYGSWHETGREHLSSSVKSRISRTEVTQGDYGKGMTFFMNDGSWKVIPLSRDCGLNIGDTADLDKGEVITIAKDNEERYRWMQ